METTDEILRRIVDAIQMSIDQTPEETPTVEEAISEFLASLEARGRSARTIQTYRQRLGLFARAGYGDLPVSSVKARHVDEWIIFLRRKPTRFENHPDRPTESGGLSPHTVNGRIQSLTTFFYWCKDRGYTNTAPTTNAKRKPVRIDASKAMKPEDLTAMLAVAAENAEGGYCRDLALLMWLADTGARIGETVDLLIPDIDFENLEATIDGKTGPGIVDFTPPTADALSAYLNWRPDHIEHDFVWVNIGGRGFGRPLTPNAAYQALRRLARAAGVTGRFNPHSIRHLVGQTWADNTNLELTRKKLRHANIASTAIYSNQDRKRVKETTKKLSWVNRGED